MKVSVVIPVYNAVRYIAQAVQSALDQPQTGEVLLVEDGCPNPASLPTCRRLAESDPRVRLLRHPAGENRGPSASRNLGIASATFPYLAFLDADDFYLPGRFVVTEQVFADDPTVEAVYEMTGTFFQTEAAERLWREQRRPPVTCIEPGIPPNQLFESMFPVGKRGQCHLNALTLKREVMSKTGLFILQVGQDTALLMRLAACARWLPGQLNEPVAMRRVHDQNRTTGCAQHQPWAQKGWKYWRGRTGTWMVVFRWLDRQGGQKAKKDLVLAGMRRDSGNLVAEEDSGLKRAATLVRCLGHLLCHEPRLLKEHVFLRGFARDIYHNLSRR